VDGWNVEIRLCFIMCKYSFALGFPKIYVEICIHVCLGACTCVCMCVCVCMHVCIHALYVKNLHFIFICVYLNVFQSQGEHVYKVCALPDYNLCE
jgi:hypothetical protein